MRKSKRMASCKSAENWNCPVTGIPATWDREVDVVVVGTGTVKI